jgi:hypothetical protein
MSKSLYNYPAHQKYMNGLNILTYQINQQQTTLVDFVKTIFQ